MKAAVNERGFALIETLIAVAIMAAMLGLAFRTVIDTSVAARQADDRRRAALVAESVMARIGATIAPLPGETQGIDSEFGWQVSIQPAGNGQANVPINSIAISVWRQPGRPLVTLETLALPQ